MKIPLFVLGSLAIGALVAASCVLSFEITRTNAEDSINTVSRQLSSINIRNARTSVKRDLLEEPELYLKDLKEGYSRQLFGPLESGMYNGSSSTARSYFQDGNVYLKANTSSATFIAIIEEDGNGCVVRLDETYGQLTPQGMYVYAGVQMGPVYTLYPIPMPAIPLDLRVRPYYTVVANSSEYRKGGMVWTGITTTTDSEFAGLIMNLATALTHPYTGQFFGVATVTVGFQWIDLKPYLSNPRIDMLMIDSEHYLVASSSADTMDLSGNTAGDRVALNASLNTTALYAACYRELPPLSEIDAAEGLFKKFHFEGKTWWLEALPMTSNNLKMYLICLTPEEIYFQKIYDGNKKTINIVIVLVVASVLIAVALILAATLPLNRLGKAFDSVAQMKLDTHDVERVPKGSWVRELNSLQLGFWHAVGTVRQVQAFVPIMEDSDQDTDLEDSRHDTLRDSVTVTSRSMSKVSGEAKSDGNKLVTDQLSIGLKKCATVTVLCMKSVGFDKLCKRSENLPDAVSQHGQLFGRVHEFMKRCNGYLLNVRGDKVLVGWGVVRSSQGSRSSAVQLAMQIANITEPKGVLPLHVALHTCTTVYGILGKASQRFQVFGSEPDDVSHEIVQEGVAHGFPILGSESFVRDIGLLVHHKVDVLNVPGVGSPITVHWIESIADVKEEEWMYQLEEAQREKKVFLEPYFEALGVKDWDTARRELIAFEAHHEKYKSLAFKHLCSLEAHVKSQ